MKEEQWKLLKAIEEKEEAGEIVIATLDGLMSAKLEDFIRQPSEGVLYDLNRGKLTTITLAGSDELMRKRWINDYAVAVLIEFLMGKLEEQHKM